MLNLDIHHFSLLSRFLVILSFLLEKDKECQNAHPHRMYRIKGRNKKNNREKNEKGLINPHPQNGTLNIGGF